MILASQIVRFRDGTSLSAFLRDDSDPSRQPFLLTLAVHAAETDVVISRVERTFPAADESEPLSRFESIRERVRGLEPLLQPPDVLFDRI